MDDLERLAELVRTRNETGRAIAEHIGLPARIGCLGEFIAGRVFDIELATSGSQKAIDGHFRSGALAGRSVNVKWYSREESLLDITPDALPDEYLVLTGPRGSQGKGEDRPWLITSVYLFDADELVSRLRERGLRIGIASSVRRADWNEAEVYPEARNTRLVITGEQRRQLVLFGA